RMWKQWRVKRRKRTVPKLCRFFSRRSRLRISALVEAPETSPQFADPKNFFSPDSRGTAGIPLFCRHSATPPRSTYTFSSWINGDERRFQKRLVRISVHPCKSGGNEVRFLRDPW